MRHQFGSRRDCSTVCPLLQTAGGHIVETLRVSKVLFQKGKEIFASQLFEKRIQTIAKRGTGKAGSSRTMLQREFAKWVIALQPILREAAQSLHQTLSRTFGQVALAV